jgi:alkanesulfonate monooxygenase SsuD/methylene tetrahydromethanopterin reductase-like flavin-dependent oxidoreductase (luciferase family)
MTRQMVMVGFLQAQNCTNLPSSWRHPESRDDSMSADYYQEIARILEAGKFHMAFFDDRLAMPTATATITRIPSNTASAA